MKLSEQCIEAIEDKINGLSFSECYESGAEIALTTESIYSKAGLISLEDALGFAEWIRLNAIKLDDYYWATRVDNYYGKYAIQQLFQIYQEQKNKL